jgi:hypothetical protein
MLKIGAAIAILLATSSAAEALCVSYPDDISTGYVENNTAQALCLQRELSQRAEFDAEQARLNAELGNIRIMLEQQRQMLIRQRALNPWPAI